MFSAIVVEHITRLRRSATGLGAARLLLPGEIIGEPSYAVDTCPPSRHGDHNYAAILAGVGRVVNAIPAVVAAESGIRTTGDLPLCTGPGLTVHG